MQPIISVALLPKLLPSGWAQAESVAVVIDTLRFTSTACVALAAGAKAITVVSDIEGAKRIAASLAGNSRLCGERSCVRIPGFDLGNSPAEYTAPAVAGCELVFSTTNGTVAVEAARPAREIILGSLLNRRAVCQWLFTAARQPSRLEEAMHVWCLCAGTDGQVALEDVLTAGAIVQQLCCQDEPWQTGNDASLLALEAWKGVVSDAIPSAVVDRLRMAIGGRNLIDTGFEDDLSLVADLDALAGVPRQSTPGRFQLG